MPNRLAEELSPYLLQHQNNPVDWYPWGEEAFEKARVEKKPVFLSIGYATCHWCHVMEHESFEDKEVAALMNEVFVSIKVDREERPDIDQVYMAYCQLSTGHGGWPLTIVMTPDKEPFYAATYIPKHARFGRPGMMELIPRIQEFWTSRYDEVIASARKNAGILAQASSWESTDEVPVASLLTTCFEQLRENHDPVHGGFGTAPKFPSPHQLLFLLRYWYKSQDPDALQMVTLTLQKMRLGGIFDHVGFGFHRYATDAEWLLPHFEKMLYDQAMIALAAIEAYEVTRDKGFKEIADKIMTYVTRDMTAPEGGFYSAEDADSEGEEGKFYVWTEGELLEHLGDGERALFIDAYKVRPDGNFADEATGEKTGANILHLDRSLATYMSSARTSLEKSRAHLFEIREQRIHPLKDDKVLTDWNGLMIAAFARYGQVFNDPEAEAHAQGAADFIRKALTTDEGRLYHRFREGHSGLQANLDDYAFLIWGLIELYQASFNVSYLQWALDLQDTMVDLFWDPADGAFFFAPDDGEPLISRPKEGYDGAIPSGNSIALSNLLRLARMTGRTAYEEQADQLLKVFGKVLDRQPTGFTAMLMGLGFSIGPSYEIVVVGSKDSPDTQALLQVLRDTYLPHAVLLLKDPNVETLASLAPFTAAMHQIDQKATAYVCQNFQCHTPITTPESLTDLLQPQTANRKP